MNITRPFVRWFHLWTDQVQTPRRSKALSRSSGELAAGADPNGDEDAEHDQETRDPERVPIRARAAADHTVLSLGPLGRPRSERGASGFFECCLNGLVRSPEFPELVRAPRSDHVGQ